MQLLFEVKLTTNIYVNVNIVHFADRPKPAAGSKMRDKGTINRLKMYKSGGKAIRLVGA